MQIVARPVALDHPVYTIAELAERRRSILLFARSLPRSPERNQLRQIALSLRALFKNKPWLDAHTLEGPGK